ncbi:MAG: thymidylate synthase [Planctomycetota bacterium]
MRQYLDLLREVYEAGSTRDDRTGVGTRSLFGRQVRYDLRQGFPLLTTKKIHFRSVVLELIWFLQGRTDVGWLKERKVRIWDEWATAEQCARFGRKAGDLGPVYGHQWRRFGATLQPDGTYADDGVDQIQRLLDDLRTNPTSRRHIVTGWNPREADQVALPPCHTLFQLYADPGARELSCQLYQRSADIFLGVPFNIASYSLLTMMIAHVIGYRAKEFVHTFGDVHLYGNHLEQAREQLSRTPRTLPTVRLDADVTDLFQFTLDHIHLEGYDPAPHIAAPVAV